VTSLDIRVSADAPALADTIAAALVDEIAGAVAARGRADVVLTGGGIGIACLGAVRDQPAAAAIDWAAVHLWWGDERYLPDGDPERNVTQAREALLDALPVPEANVHAMPARALEPEDAADGYADELARCAPSGASVPAFDVVMLGIGPEGHIASLFPHSDALMSGRAVVAVPDSPKPPPVRISLTLPSIRAGRQVWIMASGESKAEAVARCADPSTDPRDLPAAGARGREATLLWVDNEAAALLG